MKYISRDALKQILDAYIEASQHKLELYKNRDDILRCEGKIQAYEIVKETLDSVVGIDSGRAD